MALLMATVENGKIQNNSTEESTAAAKKKKKEGATSGLDKEAFLQLLVAQMQYQDPLEPMDNTEYVSQLATFSQLEATQNLADTVTYGMANDLVGKYVILNTDMGTVSGRVDYVMYENGEILLAVDDGVYSLDTLDTVANSDYYEAFQMASLFSAMIAKLPPVGSLTAGDAGSKRSIRRNEFLSAGICQSGRSQEIRRAGEENRRTDRRIRRQRKTGREAGREAGRKTG